MAFSAHVASAKAQRLHFRAIPLTSLLRENGTEAAVAVADLGTMFSRDNPLYAKLETGL